MNLLDKKLLRDLWRMRSQAFTIALVVAAGVAGFIGSLSTYDSMQWSRASYYDAARFADVFAELKRAPKAIERRIAEIPGVADVQSTVQFEAVQGADAEVVFNEPKAARVRHEIAHAPGVRETEVSRVVPVRLVSGHLSYRTAIQGIAQDARLRRLLDANLRRYHCHALESCSPTAWRSASTCMPATHYGSSRWKARGASAKSWSPVQWGS